MVSIDALLTDILKKEGGYVNNPADKGGPTRLGITQNTLSAYLGRKASIEDVKNLSVEVAKEIYSTLYYHAPRIDTLPEAIQPVILDMAVNSGPKQAIKTLQRVINDAALCVCDVDGVLGLETREAAKKTYSAMRGYMVNAIVSARLNFYQQIVAKDPTQQIFLRGWEARAKSFLVEV